MTVLTATPLVASATGTAILAVYLRRHGSRLVLGRLILASLLAISETVLLLWPAFKGVWSPASALPFQLSDFSTFVAIAAMLWPQFSTVREIAYFWSVSAGILGLAFPAIGATSPSPLYFAFYVDHGTLLAAGVVLVTVLPTRIRLAAVLRAWAATILVASAAGLANLITGGDYMFLRHPPVTWSPLLLMGAWPWYVVTAWALTPIVFIMLVIPIPAPSAGFAGPDDSARLGW
jgi:hypothetical integral membrane protein (TIGR02206 family)